MANLNLNITQIRDCIQSTRDALKKYDDNVSEYNTMMRKVDDIWEDINKPTYVKTLEKDQDEFDEFEENIGKQISVSEFFCDTLDSNIAGYFEVGKLTSIKYIEQTTARSLELLDDIASKISSIQSQVGSLSVPASSSCRGEIMNLMANIDTSDLQKVREKVYGVITGIEKTITSSRTNASRNPKQEVEDKPMRVIASSKTPNMREIPTVELKSYSYNGNISNVNLNNAQIDTSTPDMNYHGKIDNVEFDEKKQKEVETMSLNENTTSLNLEDNLDIKIDDYNLNRKDSNLTFDNNKRASVDSYQLRDRKEDVGLFNDVQVKPKYDYSLKDRATDFDFENKKMNRADDYTLEDNKGTELEFKNSKLGDSEDYKYLGEVQESSFENNGISKTTDYGYKSDVSSLDLENKSIDTRTNDFEIGNIFEDFGE